jgi:diguanylate cyclase (GGDEF)-like protein
MQLYRVTKEPLPGKRRMPRIGVVLGVPKLGGLIWTLVGSCLRTEAAARQLSVTILTGHTLEEQMAALSTLVEQNVDVLVVKPLATSNVELSKVLDKARSAAIPVVALDSDIDHPAVVCAVGSDNRQAQAFVAMLIFERLNGHGKVVFLAADPRPLSGALRNASFHEVLGRYPGIELVYEATIDWASPVSRRSQGADCIRAALALVPHFDAIVATNDDAALGAVDAMLEAGRTLPLVSGYDGLPDAILAVKDKSFTATIRQVPLAIARMTIDTALAILRADSIPRRAFVPTELVTEDNAVQTALDALRFVPALIQDLTETYEQRRELQQEAIAKQSRILQTVVALSNAVGQTRDPGQMTHALVHLLCNKFGLHDAAIYTTAIGESGDERLHIRSACRPTASQQPPSRGDAPAERALFAKALASGQAQLVDLSDGGPTESSQSSQVVRSRLVLPLRTVKRGIGVLDLQSDKPKAFDNDTIEVLEAIAHQIATALDNANLYAQTVRLAESELRESRANAQHAERARFLSNHDALTGLPNRRLFNELLDQAIGQARRREHKVAVMFVDLDRFKQINDTLGHEAGDELLKQVSMRLKACLRESDTVARQGGDEFVVLLPELTEAEAPSIVAQKIIHAMAYPFTLIGHEFRITASLGIALCPDDGSDKEDLTKHADIAMYHAKTEGKNTFRFYSARLKTHSLERLALEASLRGALERDEFVLHYQAKREMQGRIKGMEVLLRWQHPELGMLAPRQFLPVAEETGLIMPLGKWVIKTACRQNVEWRRTCKRRLVVSVNLTPRQFADDNLLDDVELILAESGMDPHLLEFEITESTLLRDSLKTLQVLTRLNQAGIRIAIDDFGTGYSLLSTLRRFPLDAIKINRSLIRAIGGSSEDHDLANAIVAMGHSLSLTIVAHGVETQQEVDRLRTLACDELQGFYFDTPVPADQFARSLQAEPSLAAAG